VEELAKKGFDPLFGARPLRRVIQDDVENAVANLLLTGGVKPRETIVLVASGQLEVEKAV
jgi:ATP-dependent Clp protease ATP-binding subunit ClpC